MLRKLTKLITNNFGLKILAVVFAVVLWMVVVNTEDPERTQVFTVPVSIENADYLTGMGKTYEILNSNEISFRVTGKRSIIEELSESDFTATANMENINEDMTTVPVTVTASRYSSQIEISKINTALKVSVENLITDQFEIEVVTEGTPASGCYIDRTRVTPEKVTVTGAQSVVDQIASARVTVNVEGAEESIATNGDIVLLDENGNVISQERLSLNRTVAAVDVAVLMGKSVPIKFETTGEPASGYRCDGVNSTVSSVRVTGATEILDSLEELTIQSAQLDIEGANKDFKAIIDLEDFLPDGVSLADGEPAEIEVTVKIEGQATKSFDMPVSNITVQGLADNLELQFDSDTVAVNLTGFAEELEEISASELKGTLDASSLSAGTYSAAIQLQGNYTVADLIRVSVTVTDKNASNGTGTSGSGDSNPAGNSGTSSGNGGEDSNG